MAGTQRAVRQATREYPFYLIGILVTLAIRIEDCKASKITRHDIIHRLIDSNNSLTAPFITTGIPTKIEVQIGLISIDNIDQTNMDYTITIFFRMSWEDPRLNFYKLDPSLKEVELSSSIQDKIWTPDLYFVNSKEAFIHDVTVPNSLINVEQNGSVRYSGRISLSLDCDMDLRKFPFDSQVCHVTIESYSHSANYIYIVWKRGKPVTVRKNMSEIQFKLLCTDGMDCTREYEGFNTIFSCVRAQFYLKRMYGYYMTQVYLPSGLIVILSWVSFWLDVEATPARITLGLLTVLTMNTQTSEARSSLPRLSYIKAIDVWMGVCLLFVLASLVEFAIVNVYARGEAMMRMTMELHQSMQESLNLARFGFKSDMTSLPSTLENRSGSIDSISGSRVDPKKDITFLEDPAEVTEPGDKCYQSKMTMTDMSNRARQAGEKARKIDAMARIGFPSMFMLFNFIYWIFYMTWIPKRDH